MTLHQLASQATALGLKLSVKFYPVSDPIRDMAQVRYIRKFLDRIGGAWKVTLDAPIPLPGDLRAIDVILAGPCLIAVEVISRLTDVQAAIRSAQLKQRDFGASRLVIVVGGTEANRRSALAARIVLGTAFDLDTRHVMRELANGRDPGSATL